MTGEEINLKEIERKAWKSFFQDGILEQGVIDKNSIGAEKSETLYHRLIKDYGADFGRHFLNSMSKLLNEFISMKGFSYSLEELDLSPETHISTMHR